MKKVIVLMMLIMSVGVANAQWSLTPEVGMTSVNRQGSGEWKSGWKLGVGVEYEFSPLFALKSGVHYTQRGFEGISPIIHNDEGYYMGYYDLNRHFLQLPIMGKLSWNIDDNVRFNIAAGPYLAYQICNRWSNSYSGYGSAGYGGYYHPHDYSMISDNTQLGDEKKFDWGFTASAGLEIKQWVVNVGYEASMSKEYSWDDIDNNYHTISLSVGYKFKLGK